MSAGLILFFLLGRISAPGGSSAKVTQLQTQVAKDEQTISRLQTQLNAAAANATPTPTPTSTTGALGGAGGTAASPTPTPTATASTGPGTAQTYTVKSGDTLSGIAAKFYGKTGHDLTQLIADANNITDPTTIRAGMKLTIPPAPAGTTPTAPQATTTVTPKPTSSASPKPTSSASPKATSSATQSPRVSASPSR